MRGGEYHEFALRLGSCFQKDLKRLSFATTSLYHVQSRLARCTGDVLAVARQQVSYPMVSPRGDVQRVDLRLWRQNDPRHDLLSNLRNLRSRKPKRNSFQGPQTLSGNGVITGRAMGLGRDGAGQKDPSIGLDRTRRRMNAGPRIN